jgi:hypothetical protein
MLALYYYYSVLIGVYRHELAHAMTLAHDY